LRPFKLLVLEPILLIVSIYVAVVYGILYLLFEAYPIVFIQQRGWSAGVAGLAFIPVGIGAAIGSISTLWWQQVYLWLQEHRKKVSSLPYPEARLPMTMAGGPLIVIALFWFGWTSYKSIFWLAPMSAGVPLGAGLVFVFIGFINYLTDCYTVYAASALAANTVLRSSFGAGFPLFTSYMFNSLGVQWACSLLGFVSAGLAIMPFIFFFFGPKIRSWFKFAVS